MKNERGQAMVLVVFAIIGLAAVIGLALDGGKLYQTRREVQNAADAMAMAGTRVLAAEGCTAGGDLENLVCQAIVDYGTENGVTHDLTTGRIEAWYVNKDATRLSNACVGTGVPNGTTGVEVTAQLTQTTTFMRIVGQDNMSPVGNATAMFGPVVQSGGGILPIGFPVQRVDEIIGSGNMEFTMFDGSGSVCRRDGVDCPSDPPANSQRGWLNFNYIYNTDFLGQGAPLERTVNKSFSNDDLKEWAVNGSPYPIFAGTRGGLPPYYSDGDYIAGDPGTRDVTRRDICEAYMNQTVYLPLFDYVYVRSDMQSTFSGQEPSIGWTNSHYYHIVGFMAATLDGCDGGGSNGTIGGTFTYAVVGEGQINPGDGIGSGTTCLPTLKGVTLWE
ncbi:MAG: Tad domain-containing protein [Anaerolineae bacterium]|nr:Tad domain-containing protein [Anaerolineae bacterium]